MIVPQFYHRVVSDVLRMLKHRSLDNIQACRPLGVLGSRCTSQRTAELDGNGDFFTGSAEGNRLMNKRQFYHRVSSGVRMDAHT